MMSPESWQFSRHSCYSLEGCCEIGIQQGDWTRTLDSLIGKCTFFYSPFILYSLLSFFSPPPHPLQRNTTSNPHRWTVHCVYFQECYEHLGIWRCCVFNNPACQNPSKSHQTEWKVTGRQKEPGACLQLSASCPKRFAKPSRVSFHLITSPHSDVSLPVYLYECSLAFLPNCFWPHFTFSSLMCPSQRPAEQDRIICYCAKKERKENSTA